MLDHLIIGGGVAGAATAWFLAQRGARSILVVDREAELGAHSTAKNAGILRTWIAEKSTRELAEESLRFLGSPPAGFSDVPLFEPCGLVLEIPEEQLADFEDWAARRPGGARALDESAFRARLPHVSWRPGRWFEIPADGRLDAAAIHAAFVSGARRAGVEFRTRTGVRELLVEHGAVRGVRLDDGSELRAGRTILAAGGWAAELGRAAGSPLVLHPRRRHLLVTAVDESIDPRWPVVWSDRDRYYARPESGGILLCACDETEVDPDACNVEPDVLGEIAVRTAAHLPRFADAGAAHYWCGMRTFADDARFAIGDDPELAGLFWVAALGGHGMTTSAAVGRLAADLLTGRDAGPLANAVDPRR
jgi:glycine/D-amino acid oxidase-like deaminating enzyme